MATILVDRLELMRLIFRYKGLLEWELARLQELSGEHIELTLPEGHLPSGHEPLEIGSPEKGVPPEIGRGRSGSPIGEVKFMMGGVPPLPPPLESNCVGGRSIDGYTALVDAATPYVRALAEP